MAEQPNPAVPSADQVAFAHARILSAAEIACGVVEQIVRRAVGPAPAFPPVVLGEDARERLRNVAEASVRTSNLLRPPFDRKNAYSALVSAFRSEFDQLKWSHLADRAVLKTMLEEEFDAQRSQEQARRAEASARFAALFASGAALIDKAPSETAHDRAPPGDRSVDPAVTALLRKNQRVLRKGQALVGKLQREFPEHQRTISEGLDRVQEFLRRQQARPFIRGFQQARFSFFRWRCKYWFVRSVSAAPYVVAVAVAFAFIPLSGPRMGQSSWKALVVGVVALAILKRFVSVRLTKALESHMDDVVRSGIDATLRAFVVLEADLAGHQALRLFYKNLADGRVSES